MPTDYLRLAMNHFLLQAAFHAYAMNMTNGEFVCRDDAAPEFRVSTNEMVRLAVMGRYMIIAMYEEADEPPWWYREDMR
jgi:hypothetical protein